MSTLPHRPSLAHLRKQAKALLEALRQHTPDSTLTDAQHALAREYGFASWPKLKSHVERLAARSEPPIFPRLTPKARESLFFSWHEANQLRSGLIEPGHLLLGLIRAGTGLKGRLFEPLALPLDRARALMARQSTAGAPPVPPNRYIAFGPRVEDVFRTAVAEADANHHERIGLAHLLIGLLRASDGADRLPEQMGIGLERVRERLATYLNEERG